MRLHAYAWRDIANSLGFTAAEVRNIETSLHLVVGGPSGYVSHMMEKWQQWAPGDARGSQDYATLHSLCSAVDKAGLGMLAKELAEFQRK